MGTSAAELPTTRDNASRALVIPSRSDKNVAVLGSGKVNRSSMNCTLREGRSNARTATEKTINIQTPIQRRRVLGCGRCDRTALKYALSRSSMLIRALRIRFLRLAIVERGLGRCQ